MSNINFAIPDIKILGKSTTSVKKNIKSGFINENIARIDRSKQYNLSFDGRKVSPGCTENNVGDISLFGLEGPLSTEEQNASLKSEKKRVDDIAIAIQDDQHVKGLLSITTGRIKELRDIQVNQQISKISFKKAMVRDPSTMKWYTQAISLINTFEVFSMDVTDRLFMKTRNYVILCPKSDQLHNIFHLVHV